MTYSLLSSFSPLDIPVILILVVFLATILYLKLINKENMRRKMLDTDDELWAVAAHAALRVEFLSNGRELFLYTNALYAAMMWGWGKSN